MKATVLVTLLGFPFLATVALADLPDPTTYHSAKADIVFQHPDKFKDIKDAYMPTEKGEKYLLEVFGKSILEQADSLIPTGYHLTMTFTDVDFAGDFEPWHGAQAEDIRFIKDIYPPDYKFTWSVTDASGHIVKQGTEDLRDIDFQMNRALDDIDPIPNDRGEIRDWMRTHLRKLGK